MIFVPALFDDFWLPDVGPPGGKNMEEYSSPFSKISPSSFSKVGRDELALEATRSEQGSPAKTEILEPQLKSEAVAMAVPLRSDTAGVGSSAL